MTNRKLSSSELAPAHGGHERVVTLVTIALPFVAVAVAVFVSWGEGITWLDLFICGALYLITAGGIAMGFHRLFTHKSFKCSRGVKWALAIAGSMAAQGPLLYWVALHRRHHQHSDDEKDPHSPHAFAGSGSLAIWRGWWHAHVGWMIRAESQNYFRLVGDLVRDPVAAAASRMYLVWVVAGLALPALIGGLATGRLTGAWTALLWGGLVRIFLVHHVTWSINSICHLFGTTPYATQDESRNNAICGVLALGEGWHNNHHAFPSSARHGLRWWQLDITYLTITGLRWAGLAWDVRLPSRREQDQFAVRGGDRSTPPAPAQETEDRGDRSPAPVTAARP